MDNHFHLMVRVPHRPEVKFVDPASMSSFELRGAVETYQNGLENMQEPLPPEL